MLWDLFALFVQVGFLAFGGGYAVIPLIEHEVMQRGWLPMEQFQELVALAGMSPGPIATNSAILIGYRLAGPSGAAASAVGIVLPSLIMIIVIAGLFGAIHRNRWVKASLYGLRPVVTALIAATALRFGLADHIIARSYMTWIAVLFIAACAIYGLIKYKLHPFTVIFASAMLGIILF